MAAASSYRWAWTIEVYAFVSAAASGRLCGFVGNRKRDRTLTAKAVAEGAISHVEPQVKPWGQTVAYVRDLNGFLVELCSAMG